MTVAAVEVGERLTAARERKGMTSAKLADVAGIARHCVYRLESGESMPRAEKLIPLATVLDLDLHWLLTGDYWEPRP